MWLLSGGNQENCHIAMRANVKKQTLFGKKKRM
jgi:hypothetical protein